MQYVKAEQATLDDVQVSDVLLLASSTWNTGGNEGQLNPHMVNFLKRIAEVNLRGKRCIVLGLGDERYRYTAKAADHLEEFVKLADGILVVPAHKIVNEPYGQEKAIEQWCLKISKTLKK